MKMKKTIFLQNFEAQGYLEMIYFSLSRFPFVNAFEIKETGGRINSCAATRTSGFCGGHRGNISE